MNIVFSCDEKYAPFLAMTLASILLNSAEEDAFSFYVLDGGLSRLSKGKVAALRKYKDFSIEYIPFDYSLVEKCPTMSHFSKAAYFRFFIADLLPGADRALYLDVDLIVLTSLAPLYTMDIGKNIVAAVPRNKSNRLGIEGQMLFNSGVMVMDTAAWRKWKIADKLIAATEKIQDIIQYVDQDVLNYFFAGKYTNIDIKWNVRQQELGKIKNANIIHFSGNKFVSNEYSTFLFEYLDKTEFDSFNTGSVGEFIQREMHRQRTQKALVQTGENKKSVAFIVTRMLDLTCLQSVIEEFSSHAEVAVTIYLVEQQLNGTVDSFVKKKLQESGLKYTVGLASIPEEIVFFANPYLSAELYLALHTCGKKMVYIPYGSSISKEEYSKALQHNLIIHNLAWRIYALDDFYVNVYKENCSNFSSESIKVIHTTPKFDQILRMPLQKHHKTRSFLWNVHFDVTPNKHNKGRSTTWSAFFSYYKSLYEFFSTHKESNLIIRPHHCIYERNNVELLHELQKFETLPNAVIENAVMFGYGESLDKAHAFITDISSMIIDMAVTGKPIIMLTYENSSLCNEYADKIFSSFVYTVASAAEFENVATGLTLGHDPLFEQRQDTLHREEFFTLSRRASEIIVEDIFPDLSRPACVHEEIVCCG